MILITSIVLGAGLLLSWILSRVLYVPINRIETHMETLESERRDTSYTVRQNTLRNLVQL